MTIPEIQVDSSIRSRLGQGHPWIYRNHVREGRNFASGQWVRVRCGGWSAYGLWDAESPIAVRLFSREQLPDATWIAERVWDAWELRASLRDHGATSAYRWIYGEGDGLPGLVVDRYGDYATIQTYAASVQTLVPMVATALRRCDPELRGVLLREREPDAATEAASDTEGMRLLWGEWPPNELVVQEHGLYLQANLFQGQKTGLFLDQRENRRTLEQFAGGRTILNCFAYTGAFSLYALRGGAAQVVSVDQGRGLAEAAAANLALNQLEAARHSFVTEDCFALLDGYAKAGRSFQLIILDPPSFARQKSNMHAAVRAYTRLNALALRCLEAGGLLVSASCTSQVSPEQFRSILADAALQAQVRLQLIHEAGQPLDHPVPACFPEGRYLKFVVARMVHGW
ncbi:class I SAM-dependent rRNA methyltransferase [Candidatus Viridilinea mediisalina]|uniref:SAM-dependent methyltransferase n=1 Tax=Candidatus Viridilinea mediisalina TaxID=2024553 RepID=A0A2A6RF57_9CHLR|nr:class I SAM-dependent rRNA methyltransferase [Candidatus Viridilinea mediisalina]PDW01717.1 SAM-dependent methyltransferase [Candidatus Viridilinea mediisalina]